MLDKNMMNTSNRNNLVERGETIRAPRVILIFAATAVFGALFLAAAVLLTGCSSDIAASLKAEGGARLSIKAEVPAPLAAKFRKLAQAGSDTALDPSAPLFDIDAVRRSTAERPSLKLISLSRPSPESIKAEFDILSLAELATSKDIAGTGFLSVQKSTLWTQISIKLDRTAAAAAASLFPGIDPYLMEALSPPALEEDPVTAAEYRTMLKSVLGEKAMPSMEAAAVTLTLAAPGKVLEYSGGSLSGSVLTVKIPIIDALVLERPIEIRLRWSN